MEPRSNSEGWYFETEGEALRTMPVRSSCSIIMLFRTVSDQVIVELVVGGTRSRGCIHWKG